MPEVNVSQVNENAVSSSGSNENSREENPVKNLRSKISAIRFGMFTTVNHEGSLLSRPMTQQALDDDGSLWFFTSDTSEVAIDITREPKVNVTFAEPSDSLYISIFGRAEVVKNREKAAELWSPAVAAWFPEGLDDPHLSLLKISIHSAEYWDSHSNKMMQIFAMAKAVFSGETPKGIGSHQKIDFK